MTELLFKLTHVYQTFMELTKSNPIIAGAVSLWGLGVITYIFKGIPARIWYFIKRQITTTLVINNSDLIYYHLLKWISEKKMHSFVRTLSLGKAEKSDYGANIISMGYGHQWFFHDRTLMTMDRHKEEANNTIEQKEQLILTVFSRKHKAFYSLFKAVTEENKKKEETIIYKSGGQYWNYLTANTPRSFDSVILPSDIKKQLIEHIDTFLTSKEWYMMNGIPWKTGILLMGPPGTGKTSLIKGLCAKYNRNMYLINPSSGSDESIQHALAQVPQGGIAVIEDIDACGVGNRDETKADEWESTLNKAVSSGSLSAQAANNLKSMAPKAVSDDDGSNDKLLGVTLSGLLNAIDGVVSGEGRVLIATTNHPEKLDPALTRPGRFDLKLEIGYMTNESFRTYMTRIFPALKNEIDHWFVKPNTPPCDVQQLIMHNRNNPYKVLNATAVKDPKPEVFSEPNIVDLSGLKEVKYENALEN